MDLEIIKKKLSTYQNSRGQVRNVPDELLLETLSTWEHWTGSTPEFYRGIGIGHKGMASMMGKAKRLRREGKIPTSEFQEITESILGSPATSGNFKHGIEICWDQGKVIRFAEVAMLVDFLKKVA
jgi:hypothetical protein